MRTIKILGPGCTKYKQLEDNVRQAVAALGGVGYDVRKISDPQQMMSYNMLSSPGLVVDERLIMTGKVPTVDELKSLLAS